jgi:type IV pilus assembly protein PilE
VIDQVRPVHKILGKASGLSLVELLAAVTIVGILVASAVPVYRNFIVKAKMAEGESAVLDVRILQQQYYSNTHLYTTDLSVLGYAPMPSLRYYSMEVRLGDPADPSGLHYQVVAKAKLPELDHWYLSVYGDGREELRHGPPD